MATVKKKSFLRRVFDNLFRDELERDVESLAKNVARRVKQGAYDAVTDAAGFIILGDDAKSLKRGEGYTSRYRNISVRKPEDEERSRHHSSTDLDYDIRFDSLGEAESVLECMRDQISEYGRCTINDYLAFAGETTDNFQTVHYGWTNLEDASVARRSWGGGYSIILPRACALRD